MNEVAAIHRMKLLQPIQDVKRIWGVCMCVCGGGGGAWRGERETGGQELELKEG